MPIVTTNSSPSGRSKRVKAPAGGGGGGGGASPFFTENYVGGVQTATYSSPDPTSGFWWGDIDSPRKAIVDDPGGGGGKVFRIIGRPAGSDVYDNSAWIEHSFVIGPANLYELWVEYYFRVGPEWEHRDGPSTDNGKFFMVFQGAYDTKMMVGMEYERGVVTNPGGSAIRGTRKTMPSGSYEDFEFTRPPLIGGPNGPITKDTWHQLRFRFKTSTDGYTADGAFQFWVDGVLTYDRPTEIIADWTNPAVRAPIDIGRALGAANAGFDVDTNHYFKGWKFYDTNPGW